MTTLATMTKTAMMTMTIKTRTAMKTTMTLMIMTIISFDGSDCFSADNHDNDMAVTMRRSQQGHVFFVWFLYIGC